MWKIGMSTLSLRIWSPVKHRTQGCLDITRHSTGHISGVTDHVHTQEYPRTCTWSQDHVQAKHDSLFCPNPEGKGKTRNRTGHVRDPVTTYMFEETVLRRDWKFWSTDVQTLIFCIGARNGGKKAYYACNRLNQDHICFFADGKKVKKKWQPSCPSNEVCDKCLVASWWYHIALPMHWACESNDVQRQCNDTAIAGLSLLIARECNTISSNDE